jgi:cytosine/adenosine deaminase-related metal-dependent hydrolase
VLGRSDIGSLEPGKCADFFTLDLNSIAYAGGLADPVAAVVFCAPTPARHTVVGGRLIVDQGSRPQAGSQYGREAVVVWARSQGASEEQIAHGRACLL